jgi:hypothetical protein
VARMGWSDAATRESRGSSVAGGWGTEQEPAALFWRAEAREWGAGCQGSDEKQAAPDSAASGEAFSRPHAPQFSSHGSRPRGAVHFDQGFNVFRRTAAFPQSGEATLPVLHFATGYTVAMDVADGGRLLSSIQQGQQLHLAYRLLRQPHRLRRGGQGGPACRALAWRTGGRE